MLKPLVLVCTDFYVPGYKGGGPIRTLGNLVEQLGDEFDFKVITRDRDLGDSGPYESLRVDQWQRVGNADVYYASPTNWTIQGIHRLLRCIPYDVLYLNSLFSPVFGIIPLVLRRLGLSPDVPAILAPRGELAHGAMSIKPYRKLLYLGAAKSVGLYKKVIWQASSVHEESDIRRRFGESATVFVAPDTRPKAPHPSVLAPRPDKCEGRLNVVFLARIARNKNLHGALEMLTSVKGQVTFTIFGPLEDSQYWQECQEIIAELPESIRVEYKGPLVHEHVISTLRYYDLLLLPTYGENFGHVILEALLAGCPVVISDRTPWRDLRGLGVGYDLPLERSELFIEALQEFVYMGPTTHRALSDKAAKYGQASGQDETVASRSRVLLWDALRRSARFGAKIIHTNRKG